MDDKPILLLGGYGNAGFSIADQVLKITDKKLIIAGRNADRARFAAGDLNVGYVGQGWDYRVEGMALDASHADAVTQACKDASLLIVAANITAHIDGILSSLLSSRTDAVFISPHPGVQAAIDARAEELKQAEVCVIAQAGLWPGLPAALIRHYSQDVPALAKASVSLQRHLNWQAIKLSDASLRDWIDTWRVTPKQVYRQGQWRNAQLWRGDYPNVKFTETNKAMHCVPQVLPELHSISKQFSSLRSLDANLSDFNTFVNWLVLPFIGKPPTELSDRLLKRLSWGLETFSQAPYQAQILAILQGKTAQQHSGNYTKTLYAQLSYHNAYELTAMAVAACIKQYLSGTLRKPGVWLQGLSVDPTQLLADIQTLGAELKVTTEVV